MIFVTVGTQLGFDRLIKVMDELTYTYKWEVFAQIAEGKYTPKHMGYLRHVSAKEYDYKIKNCKLVVSHAGMGSIITSLSNSKPIIIIPREYSLGEHRNDHQVATAKKLMQKDGVFVCSDLVKLHDTINNIENSKTGTLNQYAAPSVLEKLNKFITE